MSEEDIDALDANIRMEVIEIKCITMLKGSSCNS
jgi:hypothetical protein